MSPASLLLRAERALQQVVRERSANRAFACVPIQRRRVDTLERRVHEGERDEGDDTDRDHGTDQRRATGCPTEIEEHEHARDREEISEHECQTESYVPRDVLTPRLLEEHRALL